MTKINLTPVGPEFTVEYDMIEVTTNMPTADKTWRYTDQNGHEHYWQDGYPTLRVVVDEWYYDEDGEEVEETHLECPDCGEIIEPDMKPPSTFREYVQGRARYYVADQEISAEQASEILNQAATQAPPVPRETP